MGAADSEGVGAGMVSAADSEGVGAGMVKKDHFVSCKVHCRL